MAKVDKPNSDIEVLEIMQEYCKKKGYSFSDTQLYYMAQSCFFCYESKGWKGIYYWPPLAMRWILNNLDKQCKNTYKPKPRLKSKSVRQKILEQENDKHRL